MVKIYINSEDMTASLLLPVTPSEITVTEGTNVREYETANSGIISLIGYNRLCEVSFSSFFPANARPFAVDGHRAATDYIKTLERFREARIPCRLIIVGLGFDKTMILESFEYSMRQGEDIYYSMNFKEKRDA